MAKPKLDLSGAGLKKLAIDHCEKLVFSLCAVLLLLLAWWGYQRPVFDDSKDNPNSLITSSQRSQSRINATKWDTPGNDLSNFKIHRFADLTVPGKVEAINLMMVDGSNYPNYAPGEISLSTKPKRVNPAILAATDVQAKFAYQLIALKPGIGGGSSRIMDAMYAPEPAKAAPKKKKKKKKKQAFNSGSFGMEDNQNQGDDMQSPGEGGMGMPNSGGGTSGGNSGKQGSSKPKGPVHELPLVQQNEIEGVPVEGKIGSTFDRNDKETKPSVMWRQVVCVTAVVPFKKQVEAYEKALKGTRRYEPSNDIPKYIGLKIQRRVNGGTWHDITSKVKGANDAINALSYPSLVADEEYDPFLNSPIPAFLTSDFDQFVMHPKSALRDFLASGDEGVEEDSSDDTTTNETKNFDEFDSSSQTNMEESTGEVEQVLSYVTSENAAETKQIRFFDYLVGYTDDKKKKVEIKPNDKIEYKVNVILSHPNLPMEFVSGEKGTRRRTGGSGGSSGFGSGASSSSSAAERGAGLMSGGGSGGASSGSMMPGGSGGAGSGSMMPGGSGGAGSGSMMPGGSGASSGSGSMGGGSGRSGSSGGAMVSRSSELTIDMLGNPFITDTDLDGSIRPEILAFKGEDPVQLPGGNVVAIVNKYGLTSPDSPVSNAVVFTLPSEQYAGGSALPLTERNAKGIKFFDAEAVGELVLYQHSDAFQMKIPGKAKVYAGTPMVFDARAEVFNPIDWSIRWIGPRVTVEEDDEEVEKRGNFQFESKAIVLDVFQSKALKNQGDFKTEFLSPAEILVFDGAGNFSLQNELDDIKDFRHATFAEEAMVEDDDDDIGGFGGNRDGLQGSGGASPGQGSGFPGFGN